MSCDIVLVIESLGGGGAQHVVISLANFWAEKEKRVNILTFQDVTNGEFNLDERVDCTCLNLSAETKGLLQAISANVKRVLVLRRALHFANSPVVISFVGTTNILSVFASFGLHHHLVVSERNDPERQSLGRAWDLLRRKFYKYADVVSANSQNALQTMSRWVPNHKLVYLPNPLRQATTSEIVSLDSPYFMTAGRLHQQKGLDFLLRSFARYCDCSQKQTKLVILGEGPERDALEHLVEELGLSDRVFMPGYEDPFPWYRGALAYIQASRFEGMPNVVLEAMSMSKPVIVTDSQPGALDFVNSSKEGIVVRWGDEEGVVSALTQLEQDPVLRENMGNLAREAVLPCLPQNAFASWDKLLEYQA
ncbi:glycosyltransferase [Thalassospira alkalitolerans]|uniref:glycosyltransferase n=1 Tax=Thalassospira alkalitolerans TaxID=1293890 RepID=UPI003AA9A1C3